MAKSKNNTYKYRTTFTDVRGKRHNVYGNTKAELDEKLKASKEKWNRSLSYIENENLTLDQYFEEWSNRKLKTKSIKEGTYYQYKREYDFSIRDEIGSLRIRSISRRRIEIFQEKLLEEKGASVANRIIGLLYSIFSSAKKTKIISENPCEEIELIRLSKKDKLKASTEIHRALTVDETRLFMQYAKETLYYDFFSFMLYTGMRCGEVAALKYKDIDYENNMIHISRTISHDKNGNHVVSDTPKTYKSIRDIPLNDNIKEIIERVKEKTKKNNYDDLIFVSKAGNIVTNHIVNAAIKRTLKQMDSDGVGIERITSHCFRDTYATRCIECGMNPNTLKELLGHGSYSMTMDLYAHTLPNTKHSEYEKVKIEF